MWELKACTVCFSTDCKLYKLDNAQLKKEFFLVCGLKAEDMDGMPQYLCVECSAYVRRCKKFRDKCKKAHFAFKELLRVDKQITKMHLELIQNSNLGIAPSLSYFDTKRTHFKEFKFKWEKQNRLSIPSNETIPVFHCSTSSEGIEFEVPCKKAKVSNSAIKEEVDDFSNLVEKFPENRLNLNQSYAEQSTSNANDDADFYFGNDNFDSDDQGIDNYLCKEEKDDADGMNLEEEYASVIPISMKEAKAAVEVYKLFSNNNRPFRCEVCHKTFFSEDRHTRHMRMHDRHVSGNFLCNLCHMYYKTEFLLKTHMTEKHMYKYVCRKCPEVSFDRMSAKQHFIWAHLQKGSNKDANWYDGKLSWLSNKGGKRLKGVVRLRPVRKISKLPEDFPVYTPVSQEEQYKLIKDRKKSRNFLEAMYKCELCYRGFREVGTYSKHMRKHDPKFSGKLQCDMCKMQFRDARKMYKHMITTHLFKYSCQTCSFVCYNRGQAHMHYRWHKNVTYSCPHCKKEFKKASTRLTHIRIKHPSTNICNLCGHSFVSENGLYCHKKLAHSKEEIETSEALLSDVSDPRYCADCGMQFLTDAAYRTHLGSSNKHATTNLSIKPRRYPRGAGGGGGGGGGGGARRPTHPRNGSSEIVNNGVPTPTYCEVCNKFLLNDVQARKHYEAEHPGADFLKRYMCDVCGHTTKQYANLMVHMRTHTNEKPYGCPHCDRRFSMPSNRDRHLVVHTGEKRYQCQHCNRRFTQSSAVKLHIQTVHLKIPYAPWDKKNRKRRKELEAALAPPPAPPPPPAAHKLLLDPSADYLNTYITYND